MPQVVRRSFRAARKLIPPTAKYFKGRSMHLPRGAAVPWHTTGRREEVLVVLEGTPILHHYGTTGRLRQDRLKAGDCVFLASGTVHCVQNPFRLMARYLYFTAGPK